MNWMHDHQNQRPTAAPPAPPSVAWLSYLLGTWRGQGEGVYPTIPYIRHGEELRFSHPGKISIYHFGQISIVIVLTQIEAKKNEEQNGCNYILLATGFNATKWPDPQWLFSLSPSTEFTCKEILNCLRLSKEGIDVVLVVYSLRNMLTQEERSSLFALKILFGSEIVDYMIVFFKNEDAFEEGGGTLDGYLKNCPDFNEILEACNDRKVLFRNKVNVHESQKAKQVQELLNYVEEIARKNGKPYMNLSQY
ncbi:unnamed protein product [Microthlaspi erraticum]|uniref:AIG1-type G domain-containing protein n=1 Tax=Microthlaspi erraticum TaxID=1685480 RepID=A0A6D2I4I0_9BRAS|nr:unnamed protein product [Microthlaspi erraticum]